MMAGGSGSPDEGVMTRILVIGRSGQLATALAEAGWPADVEIVCRGRDQIDLARPAIAREAVVREKPDLVINAAAYTAVDKAESEAELAFTVNRDGPAALAEACLTIGAPLIHISTDYVFDGTKSGRYVESDPVKPASVYGASKEAGEEAIRSRLSAHVILRSAWIYAPMGHNFVRTMLRLGRERPELSVVDDQIGCPTAAAELARAVQAAAHRLLGGGRDYGTFHFAGSGSTSWFGFAEAVFELAQARDLTRRPRLVPIPTKDYPTPARRPANSVLDSTKFARLYGVTARPWRESLTQCLEEIATREATAA
jgi:dTDP-4-dehydrorhamnose reductase